jgi:hypothetical protein
MTAKRYPGQGWLIDRMQSLKYKADSQGVCLGVATMGMMAFLLKDIKTFNDRLDLAYSIPKDVFAKTMTQAQEHSLLRIAEAKREIFSEVFKEQKLNDAKQMDDFLNHLEAQERKKFNLLLNQRIAEKLKNLPELQLFPFFDGVELSQQPEEYPHLFPDKINSTSLYISSILPLINSKLMDEKKEEKNHVERVGVFLNAYDGNELVKCLQLLQSIFDQKEPTGMLLHSENHSIFIGYDPEKNAWTFIDAKNLPAEENQTIEELARKIIDSFSQKSSAAFSAEIYAAEGKAAECRRKFEALKEEAPWKQLNVITPQKTEISFEGCRLLHIAAQQGDAKTVAEFLEKKGNPNQYCDEGTALMVAAQNGHANVAALLLQAGARPNDLTPDGYSALFVAAQRGHTDVVSKLLEYKADPNQPRNTGATPFFIAIYNGHADVVKVFLEQGVDPEQLWKNQSLVKTARQLNHPEVADLLEKAILLKKLRQEVDEMKKQKNDIVLQHSQVFLNKITSKAKKDTPQLDLMECKKNALDMICSFAKEATFSSASIGALESAIEAFKVLEKCANQMLNIFSDTYNPQKNKNREKVFLSLIEKIMQAYSDFGKACSLEKDAKEFNLGDKPHSFPAIVQGLVDDAKQVSDALKKARHESLKFKIFGKESSLAGKIDGALSVEFKKR